MPRFVNPHKVHQAIVDAVKYDPWSAAGDISVSQIVTPPLALVLAQRHDHEIVVDVGDRIFSLLGQAIHVILDRAAGGGPMDGTGGPIDGRPITFTEEPLTMEVAGWKVSGRPDLWMEHDPVTGFSNVLTDWKTPMVGAMIRSDVRAEWVLQLNFYRLLYRAAGLPVDRMEIVAILKDWNKRASRERDDYPLAAFIRREVPVLDNIEDLLIERVLAHQEARKGKPRWCNTEERWARPDAYAVMKGKQKKAVAVFGEGTARGGGVNEAQDLVEKLGVTGARLRLEQRTGDKFVRCRDWCDAAPFCPLLADQAPELLKEKRRG